MYALLLNSLILMPSVFFRTLPVAILVALVYFGMIQNTSNPLWKVVFAGILTTPCIAIVRMAALRAALVAVRRTTPPTIDHLMRAQMRLAYANLLPINIVQIMILLFITALFSVELNGAATNVIVDFAKTGTSQQVDTLSEQFMLVAQNAGWLFSIVAALGFGAMGTAMAATAANAAEKKPRHDITFGVFYNFWRLAVLYYVAQVLNGIVVVVLVVLVMAVFQMAEVEIAIYVLPVAVTLYISLHFATTAAGAALSYGMLLDEETEIREFVYRNLAGPEKDAEALRELRRARQHD